MFTVNHKEGKGGFDVLPAGEYECVISKLEKKTFKSGNDGLNVTLTVRDDVEQEGQKRKIFDTLVQTDASMFKFQNYFYATQLADGVQLATLDDVIKVLYLKPVRAKIKIGSYVKDGETVQKNEVVSLKIAEVEYDVPDMESEDPFAFSGPVDLTDEDGPF